MNRQKRKKKTNESERANVPCASIDAKEPREPANRKNKRKRVGPVIAGGENLGEASFWLASGETKNTQGIGPSGGRVLSLVGALAIYGGLCIIG